MTKDHCSSEVKQFSLFVRSYGEDCEGGRRWGKVQNKINGRGEVWCWNRTRVADGSSCTGGVLLKPESKREIDG